MPTAYCLVSERPYYDRPQFIEGLERHGFKVRCERPRNQQTGDILLLWNRSRNNDPTACEFEARGGRVLIAENGFIDRTDDRKTKYYALALDKHNGAGRWYVGPEPRFPVSEEPWRKRGSHILVLPQRGIGSPGVRMPSTWVSAITKKLKRLTDRPVRVRLHPGPKKGDPLADLQGAHCAVTWGSGAGIKAIRYGFPVFHEFGKWIGSCAAINLTDDIEKCYTGDRLELWRRVTWGQWTLDEIRTGEAFDRLLHANDCDLLRQ